MKKKTNNSCRTFVNAFLTLYISSSIYLTLLSMTWTQKDLNYSTDAKQQRRHLLQMKDDRGKAYHMAPLWLHSELNGATITPP